MQPINHPKSLMEVTTDHIRNSIVSGELALGSKLSEQRLADALGVSRSPVRDALAALQSEGLVNVSPKRGSFVFTPDLREVDELCEHRGILEAASLRKALRQNPEALIERLEGTVTAMQTARDKGDARRYTLGDMQFHKEIIAGSANRSIIRAYQRTMSPISALRTHLFTNLRAVTDRAMTEHLTILDACRANDADTAADLLKAHAGHLVEDFRAQMAGKDPTAP